MGGFFVDLNHQGCSDCGWTALRLCWDSAGSPRASMSRGVFKDAEQAPVVPMVLALSRGLSLARTAQSQGGLALEWRANALGSQQAVACPERGWGLRAVWAAQLDGCRQRGCLAPLAQVTPEKTSVCSPARRHALAGWSRRVAHLGAWLPGSQPRLWPDRMLCSKGRWRHMTKGIRGNSVETASPASSKFSVVQALVFYLFEVIQISNLRQTG